MTDSAQAGRKTLIGLVSTLSWLVLLIAVASTAASLTVNSLNHVGTSASILVRDVSQNQGTVNSLIDEFKKNADSKTAAEIDKNRTKIDSTIASLGESKEFQNLLSSTLNQIAQAILNGSSSVKVDFTKIATLIASKVNEAANNTVISVKDLAKIKPQTLDLSKQSKVVVNVHDKIRMIMLAWFLWLILLGVLFLLKGWKVLRTAGWQLFSIGIAFLLIRFGAPIIADNILSNSSWPAYQRDLVPHVFKALTSPLLNLAIITTVIGILLVVLEAFLGKRTNLKKV